MQVRKGILHSVSYASGCDLSFICCLKPPLFFKCSGQVIELFVNQSQISKLLKTAKSSLYWKILLEIICGCLIYSMVKKTVTELSTGRFRMFGQVRELSETLLVFYAQEVKWLFNVWKSLAFFCLFFDAVKLENVLQKFNFSQTFAYTVFLADDHKVYFT